MVKSITKKIVGIILIVILMLNYFAMVDISQATDVVGTWDISANDGESSVTATLYADGTMEITGIGNMDNFYSLKQPYINNIKDIKKVTIEEGITNIGYCAFCNCSNLRSIYIPEGVTKIKEYAFTECSSLTQIYIPESVRRIYYAAFYGCTSLTNINMPEGLAFIDNYAFFGCANLTEIYIPKEVKYIGDMVFYNCNNLKKIEVEEDNQNYTSIDGVLFNKEKTEIVRYPEGKEDERYSILDGVTTIREAAFYNCSNLENVYIPNSVTSINNSAFMRCTNLTQIIIPQGVKTIEDNAFYYCNKLIKIDVANSVTSIGREAFKGCRSLTEIRIPEEVESIGNDIFYNSIISIPISKDKEELPIPNLLQQALNEEDILYANENIEYVNCSLNEEKTKIIIDKSVYGTDETIKIKIKEGKLRGFTINIVPFGTITYSEEIWTNETVNAILHIKEQEKVINNNESNIYTFTKNDEFTFKYLDVNGEEKEAVATVNNIDKEEPVIKSVIKEETEEGVKIIVEAEDNLSGLSNIDNITDTDSYSFDAGTTWQKSNEKIFNKDVEIEKLEILVRDNAGNMTKYGELSSITVEEVPAKTKYIEGENFDSTGMIIKAVYKGGKEEEITDYEIVDGEDLKLGQEFITIRYTEEGMTKEIKQEIEVNERLRVTINNYEIIEENSKKYIEKVLPDTTIEMLKENIETNGIIEVHNGEDKIEDEEAVIGTEMKIKIKLNEQEKDYILVVTGDLTGDGKISMSDVLKLARYNAKLDKNVTGAYLRGAEVVRDGKVGSISDLLKLSRVLAKLDNI